MRSARVPIFGLHAEEWNVFETWGLAGEGVFQPMLTLETLQSRWECRWAFTQEERVTFNQPPLVTIIVGGSVMSRQASLSLV